jgi:hypothetical protein
VKVSAITVGILHIDKFDDEGFVREIEGTDSNSVTESVLSNRFLTNLSKLRTYLYKILTVVTETFIV